MAQPDYALVPPGGKAYDVSTAIEELGFGSFQIIILFLTASLWVADAMEMVLLSFLSDAVACEWNLTFEEKAFGPQAVFLGMMAGASFWGWFEDKFGRRIAYLWCTLGCAVGGFATAFSVNYQMLLACRAFVGFNVAGSHVSVVIFMEFLPIAWRSWGMISLGVFWAFGAVVEALLAYVTMTRMSMEIGWRVLVFLSAVPLLILLLFFPLLPESARWDLHRGNKERAFQTLQWAARLNGKSLPEGELTGGHVAAADGNCFDMCRTRKMLVTTLCLIVIWIANGMGYYGMVLLGTELFEEENTGERCSTHSSPLIGVHRGAGAARALADAPSACSPLTPEDYKDAVIDSAGELPGLLLTFALIDCVGRRGAMGWCFLLFSIVIGSLLHCFNRTIENVLIFVGRGAITGAFQACFVFTPEIYPTSIRGTAIGFFSSVARIGGIITPQVAMVVLPMSQLAGLGAYSGAGLLAGIASFCIPIETAGKSLADEAGDGEEQPEAVAASDDQEEGKKKPLAQDGKGIELSA